MRVLRIAAWALVVLLLALAGAIAFGGPRQLPTMTSVSNPFRDVDFSGLPSTRRYRARDGAELAYRFYAPPANAPARGSIVLVHGSSANSQSIHPLSQSFAGAGFAVYALDMRGHGESGPRGDIAYVGQLDDDLEDFAKVIKPAEPKMLVGFSSGGGFAIRIAGGARKDLFDSYLFLAPYTDHRAPTQRPGSGGWASVGMPRLAAIAILNRLGITALNHLPTARFAVDANPRAGLTETYSYALLMNFQPSDDYRRDLKRIDKPAALVVGANDEIFVADKFAAVLTEAGRADIPVMIVPAVGHIGLTTTPAGRMAAVAAAEQLTAR